MENTCITALDRVPSNLIALSYQSKSIPCKKSMVEPPSVFQSFFTVRQQSTVIQGVNPIDFSLHHRTSGKSDFRLARLKG